MTKPSIICSWLSILAVAGIIATSGNARSATLGDWKPERPLPEGMFLHQCLTANNNIYVLGGGGGGAERVYFATVQQDGTLGPWQTTASVPAEAGYNYTAAASHDRSIYLVGGFPKPPGQPTAAVFFAEIKPNGFLGPWQKTTSLPEITHSATAVVASGHLYCLGGFFRRTVYYAPLNKDGTVGPWKATAPLPSSRMAFQVFCWNGYLHAVGGAMTIEIDKDTTYRAKINADGSLERWRRSTSLPNAVSSYAGAFADGHAYVIGGKGLWNAGLESVVAADGHFAEWTPLPRLPEEIYSAAAVYCRGRVFLTGGFVRTDKGRGVSNRVYAAALANAGTAAEGETMRVPLRFDELDNAVADGGLMRLRREYRQVHKEPLCFEAEEATILEHQSKDKRIQADADASGGFCVEQVKRMEYHFDVVTPGKYCVWVRACFPARGGWCHNEALDDDLPRMVVDSAEGEDKKWLWLKESTYDLTVGKHRLVYPSPTAWCGGARLDKVVLALAGETIDGMGPKASPFTTGLAGRALAHRVKIKNVAAWGLTFSPVRNGGDVAVEYSYDFGATWARLPSGGQKLMEVPASRPRYVVFRFQLFGQANRASPWLQGLELQVRKAAAPP